MKWWIAILVVVIAIAVMNPRPAEERIDPHEPVHACIPMGMYGIMCG